MKYTIGVDLGGTNIAAGLCDEDLRIVDKGSVPTRAERENEEIIRDMASLVGDILSRNGLTPSDIEYVGIASPGTVNTQIICTSTISRLLRFSRNFCP